MDISNANLDRIYQWVNNERSDSYIKQEFSQSFEQSSVLLKNEDKLFKCSYCLLIPFSISVQMRPSFMPPLLPRII